MSVNDNLLYTLFSNGTEFELWTEHNCDKCVKASHYNEKTDTYPKYRCAIQKHIDMAFIGDGKGSKRDYEACRSYDCPYKRTEWPERKRKGKKDKSLTIEFL